MPQLSPRARHALLPVALVFAIVAIATGLHRGEDIENHLQLADLLLRGENFYEPRPPFGTWWPPAAIGLLTPFALIARLSLPAAKAAYALAGLAFLYWAVARTRLPDWRRTTLALIAVSGPILFDFRYLNLNAILLGLIVAGTLELERERDVRAGIWFGLATTLKLFPGLLLAYLAWRRQWRAVAVAAVVIVLLTVVPLAVLGFERGLETGRTWIELTRAGVPIHRLGNQSLPEVMARLGAHPSFAFALRIAVIACTIWVLRRRRPWREEVALVALGAVLLSPVAWWYYFALAYPAWLAALEHSNPRARPFKSAVLLVAGIFMCGVLGPRAAGIPVVSAGIFMWGALSLFAVLVGTWGREGVGAWDTPSQSRTPASPQAQT